MSRQKHDAGFKKRQFRDQPPSVIDGGKLAQRLIDRGLAGRHIADRRFKQETDQPNPKTAER